MIERRRRIALSLASVLATGGYDEEAMAAAPGGGAAAARGGAMPSDESRAAFMLELHKLIETAADQAALQVVGGQGGGALTYPPGTRGLAPAERAALSSVQAPPEALPPARRVIADAVGSVVFDLFAMIDGARELEGWDVAFGPLELAPAQGRGTLHQDFKDRYAEWKKRRSDPGWSLG